MTEQPMTPDTRQIARQIALKAFRSLWTNWMQSEDDPSDEAQAYAIADALAAHYEAAIEDRDAEIATLKAEVVRAQDAHIAAAIALEARAEHAEAERDALKVERCGHDCDAFICARRRGHRGLCMAGEHAVLFDSVSAPPPEPT